MSAATRDLHEAIDAHARRTGIPYLHPDEPTVQLDLLGSKQVIEWQEGKAAFLFASEGCWSELPHLYARYGTTATAQLIAKLKTLEHATAALVCDSGMQATALAFDVLMEPGGHAVLMRQVYNKTRSYLEWMAARVGGSVTIVDDGDMAALAAAITPETRFVFAETFTNPLVRAQDFDALARRDRRAARAIAPALRLVLDTTIASPWAFKTAAARQRRRHRRRQRHQVAGRQRSRHVGLHRDQRHAVRELGDGSDGDARRHPRLAPGGGGRRGVRRRRRLACAPIGDRVEGRGVPERASQGQRGVPPVAAESSRSRRRSTRTTRVTDRCCRSASPAPTKIARATSPTCSPPP